MTFEACLLCKKKKEKKKKEKSHVKKVAVLVNYDQLTEKLIGKVEKTHSTPPKSTALR